MSPFRNYMMTKDKHFREHYGLDFEQFVIGQIFQHRPGITITQQDNAEEALDTINNAQLHYDEHYASTTEWKKCLGVSTMTLQKLIGMTCKTFGRRKAITEFTDIAMTAPIFGGDTLYAQSEILEKNDINDDIGELVVETQGFNQRNEQVASIKYKIQIYKSGKHPVEIKDGLVRRGVEDEKFSSHNEVQPNVFREQIGLYYEDLLPGEIYEHRPAKTISFEENKIHANRSLDLNPIFSNQHYCDVFHDGQVPVSEAFLAGVLTALTTRTFDRVVANLGWKNIEFHQPLYCGDTLYAISEIIDKRESHSRQTQGIMHVKTNGYNQNHQLVCSYERVFLIYKKGLGPYQAAGY